MLFYFTVNLCFASQQFCFQTRNASFATFDGVGHNSVTVTSSIIHWFLLSDTLNHLLGAKGCGWECKGKLKLWNYVWPTIILSPTNHCNNKNCTENGALFHDWRRERINPSRRNSLSIVTCHYTHNNSYFIPGANRPWSVRGDFETNIPDAVTFQ